MRMLEAEYGSPFAFIRAAQSRMVTLMRDATQTAGYAAVGVWIDDSRHGLAMRVVREAEFNLAQGVAWRPHAAFAPDMLEDGQAWLARKIRGID